MIVFLAIVGRAKLEMSRNETLFIHDHRQVLTNGKGDVHVLIRLNTVPPMDSQESVEYFEQQSEQTNMTNS